MTYDDQDPTAQQWAELFPNDEPSGPRCPPADTIGSDEWYAALDAEIAELLDEEGDG